MKVRTTMLPDVELDVDVAEYTDLVRQGILVQPVSSKQLPKDTTLPADVVAQGD